MNEYNKIQTVYMRDPNTKHKTLLEGQWSMPEFGYLAGNEWVYTEKVDGTNIRVMFDGQQITFGGNYRPDQDFVLFDVKVGDWWLLREDVEEIAQAFGLDIVPIIGRGTLPAMVELARYGFPSVWGNFLAEGIVARPSVELKTRRGDRLITKIKHKDFERN